MLITVGVPGLPPFFIDNSNLHLAEYVTVHELAHEWWPMTVASNEMTEPWLDEGFAEYSAARWMERTFGPYSVLDTPAAKLSALLVRRPEYLSNPPRGLI